MIQIEVIAAMPNLDAILAIRGIDVALIGPGDLSKSMGLAGRSDDPQVREVIDRIARQILMASDAAGARQQIARGARWVIVSLPQLVVRAGRGFVEGARDEGSEMSDRR